MGFNEVEIAMAGKLFGIASAILGGCISGVVIAKRGIKYSLYLFGICHLLSHFLFIGQLFLGHNLYFFCFLTAFEAITGGMAMAAYMAYISDHCKGQYIATQYALFTSFMGFSRVFFPAFSGFLVEGWGWF